MKNVLFPSFLLLFFFFIKNSVAQNFVNGSFELNSGACVINGSNSTITSSVTSLDAYGCGNEIDLHELAAIDFNHLAGSRDRPSFSTSAQFQVTKD